MYIQLNLLRFFFWKNVISVYFYKIHVIRFVCNKVNICLQRGLRSIVFILFFRIIYNYKYIINIRGIGLCLNVLQCFFFLQKFYFYLFCIKAPCKRNSLWGVLLRFMLVLLLLLFLYKIYCINYIYFRFKPNLCGHSGF